MPRSQHGLLDIAEFYISSVERRLINVATSKVARGVPSFLRYELKFFSCPFYDSRNYFYAIYCNGFFFTKSAEILLEFFCRRETKNFDNTKITVYVIREGIIEILAR